MSNYEYTEEWLAGYLARFDRPAVSTPDVEQNPKHESQAENVDKEVHQRFRICVHSKRRRLADSDGLCVKFALDGLVQAGLLKDDSTKYVESVTFSQEISRVEETVIEIWEVRKP